MRTLITPFALVATLLANAQHDNTPPPSIDTTAILVLDRMADMIGSLYSCSLDLDTRNDVNDPEHGTITRFTRHQVHFSGNDRMHVNSTGEMRHKGYWYNGWQVVYYDFTENNYGIVEAPSTTIATIDEVHHSYGIDFPAADFFYPTFTDDLIAQSDRIHYLGTAMVEGRECFRVVAHGKVQTVQLWVANDATFLPVRYIITDHAKGNTQSAGYFTNWRINPDLPDQLFEFQPPPGAHRVRMMPRTTAAKSE
jgi:hypothetical protein